MGNLRLDLFRQQAGNHPNVCLRRCHAAGLDGVYAVLLEVLMELLKEGFTELVTGAFGAARIAGLELMLYRGAFASRISPVISGVAVAFGHGSFAFLPCIGKVGYCSLEQADYRIRVGVGAPNGYVAIGLAADYGNIDEVGFKGRTENITRWGGLLKVWAIGSGENQDIAIRHGLSGE